MATKQEWLDYAKALAEYAKELEKWAKALPESNEQVSTQGSGIETPPPPPNP